MLPVSAKLTTSVVAIYTVRSPATRAIIKMVRAVNNSGTSKTFNVYVNTGSGDMLFSALNQTLDPNYMALDIYEYELSTGHTISASCSLDNSVDLFISGHELESNGRILT